MILNLTINKRLNYPNLLEQSRLDIIEFTKELLRIGNSNLNILYLGSKKEKIYSYLDKNIGDALINKIYPRLQIEVPTRKYLSNRVILAITNLDLARINQYILDRLLGRKYIYISTNKGATLEDNDIFSSEYQYTFYKLYLLDYILKLKVRTSIILIRKL